MFLAASLTPALAPTIRKLADLQPATLAIMHGSSFSGDCAATLRSLITTRAGSPTPSNGARREGDEVGCDLGERRATTAADASTSSSGRNWRFGTAIVRIPAATADLMPFVESSTAAQSFGSTASSRAAAR